MKSVRGDGNGGSERLFRGGASFIILHPASPGSVQGVDLRFLVHSYPGGNNYDTQSSQKLTPRVKFKTCVQNGSGSAQNAANR